MRLLFFTDMHLRARNPRWRLGNYAEDLLGKLSWVVNAAKENECDYLVFGGDFIDHPQTSLSLVNRAIDVILGEGSVMPTKEPPHFAPIFGQHDEVGNRPEGVLGSSASLVARSFAAQCSLQADSFWVYSSEEGISLSSYQHGIEDKLRENADFFLASKRCPVMALHAMIVPNAVPWPHVQIQEIDSSAEIVLSGDYHAGFPPTLHYNTWFVNPGALARLAIGDAYRKPQVALVDTDLLPECPAEYFEVPHRAPEEVFDLEGHRQTTATHLEESKYTEMLQALAAGGSSSWEALLKEVDEFEVGEEVVREARKRCKEAEEKQSK